MLRNTRASASSTMTPEVNRLHEMADQLLRQNTELREENRQMRASLALWAKVATEVCLNCSYNPNAALVADGQRQDGPSVLIHLGESLNRLLEEQAGIHIIATGGAGSSGLPALDSGKRTINRASKTITTKPAK